MKSIRTALVTGCTGQDGSYMSKSLINQEWRVIGISRRENKKIINHKKIGIDKNIQLEKCDITDQKNFEKILLKYNPEEIYNLAAQSSVGKSFENPKETFKSIIDGTIKILETCRINNYEGRIFFAGSSEIFGNTKHAANIGYRKIPLSPYGVAKNTSMEIVKLYREIYKLNCCTGVLFNHESILRDENFVIKKIIKNALQAKKNKNHLFYLGNINIVRDWGLAEEYVEAMQLINRSKEINDDVICTGTKNSLKFMIKEIFNTLGLNWKDHVKIENSLFRSQDIKESYGDPTSLYKKYGWAAKTKNIGLIRKLIDHEL